MSKLKSLSDNTAFKLTANSKVVYKLQRLDEKKRMAIYTSTKSNRTFIAGWNREVVAV